jgi:hypothetical protein
MTKNKPEDIFVDALMYNLTAPVITATGEPDRQLIETHKSNITLHRLSENIKLELLNRKECTDYEAMLYLSTLSLVGPISHDAYRVYMYLAGKYLPGAKDMLKDAAEGLEPSEQQTLTQLKKKIFADQMKQLKARK